MFLEVLTTDPLVEFNPCALRSYQNCSDLNIFYGEKSTKVTPLVFNEISNGIQFALYETPVSKAHVVDEGKPTNS